MKDRIGWISFKLAVFTVVTIVVTTALAAVIGNFRLFTQPYQVTAHFEDATGLLVGDAVKAAGVTVGRVSDISVEDATAVVSLRIDEGVDIPSDSRAEIRFRNLIGQRMVTMVDDGDSSDLLVDGDRIPLERTESAFDLTVLFEGLRPLIRSTDPDDINLVARELTQALRGRDDVVASLLGNLSNIADGVSARDTELRSLLDNLNVVTADLSGRDAQLQATLSDIAAFLTDLDESRTDLDQAIVSLDDAAIRLDRLVRRNSGDIDANLRHLSTLFDAVDDKRSDLRLAIRALPRMLLAVERTTTYGQWANLHLTWICKDDTGTCGSRWMP